MKRMFCGYIKPKLIDAINFRLFEDFEVYDTYVCAALDLKKNRRLAPYFFCAYFNPVHLLFSATTATSQINFKINNLTWICSAREYVIERKSYYDSL